MQFAKLFNDTTTKLFELLGDEVQIGTDTVQGVFNKAYREVPLRDGVVVGLQISFDCKYSPIIAALQPQDLVTFDSVDYAFIRRLPEGGDETGVVILELGTP
jgi:hypothetical protein